MAYRYLTPGIVADKTVLLRLDLNEPVSSDGIVSDDFRLQSVLPTIQTLMAQKARVIIIAHLGRPDGKVNSDLSLSPVVKRLADLLKLPLITPDSPSAGAALTFICTPIDSDDFKTQLSTSLAHGPVVLENIRFYPGEEINDERFSQDLADLADIFINDAFAVCHRASASTVGVAKLLPSFAGPLLEKEIKNLDYVLNRYKSPFVLMMGGIKISEKAQTLENLGPKADVIILGGGLANLLIYAEGFEVGESAAEKESVNLARQILNNLKHKIVLPKDVVVQSDTGVVVKPILEIKPHDKIYDIGPKTILAYTGILKKAQTICWNGPFGFFEQKSYRTGTMALAKVVGGVGKGRAFVVAGGGETVEAIRQSHQEEHIDHLSTGGGAMLEYLSGKTLPALKVLKAK